MKLQKSRHSGQVLIETIIILILVLVTFFSVCYFFLDVAQKITAEVQLIDLLKYGYIKNRNKVSNRRVYDNRNILPNEIETKVEIEKYTDLNDRLFNENIEHNQFSENVIKESEEFLR